MAKRSLSRSQGCGGDIAEALRSLHQEYGMGFQHAVGVMVEVEGRPTEAEFAKLHARIAKVIEEFGIDLEQAKEILLQT